MEKNESEHTAQPCCQPPCDAGADAEILYPGLAEAARLFQALADETRLAILRQLRERGKVCACDFLACCRLAQPTVSHHLKVLRQAGLVKAEKCGLWVYYTLDEARLAAMRRLLP